MVDMIYKMFRAEVRGVDENEGTVDMFIPVSSDSVDRDGEIVEPLAFKKTLPKFMKRPVLVASHDYRDLTNQIGEWSKLKIGDNGLDGKPKYYINAGNEQADWGFLLASKGMAAFSIGFVPKVWEDGDGVKQPRRTFKEVELLEISQVIVPSNREAIQNIRSKGVDPITDKLYDDVDKLLEELVTKPEETDEYIRIPVDRGNHEGHRIRTIDISVKEGIKAIYCGTDKVVMTYLFAKDHDWTTAKARAWVKEHEKSLSNINTKYKDNSFDEIRSDVEKELRKLINNAQDWVYVIELYSDHVIYSLKTNNNEKLFSAPYARNSDISSDKYGTVTLGQSTEVERIVTYTQKEKSNQPKKTGQGSILDEIDYLKTLIEKEGLSDEGKKSFEGLMRI